MDKIFQPFLTSKLTGQGTCLGISWSYDILKVWGRESLVNMAEGEGTVFSIQLPFKENS